MINIHNSDIQKRIIEEAKLQVAHDIVPQELTEKILPVLISNPKNRTRIKKLSDQDISCSDKYFHVPIGKKWKVLYGCVLYISTAAAGNRMLNLTFLDRENSDLMWITNAVEQEPSKEEYYNISPSSPDVSEITSGYHFLPIPKEAFLTEGCQINIYDYNGVASAADTMKIILYVEETDLLDDEFNIKVGKDA